MQQIIVASFRSRSQLFKYERALKAAGVKAEIISTPRQIAVGCGLSLKFGLEYLAQAKMVYYSLQPATFEGFFTATQEGKTIKLLSGNH